MPKQGYLGAFYGKVFTKVVEDCEDAWDEKVDTGVTSSANTDDKKEGSASASLVIKAAGVSADTLLATEKIDPAIDLTNHRRITFWIKSSKALASGDLQLLLDESVECGSPEETLNIPSLATDTWTAVTLTLSDASVLDAVVSVGLKTTVVLEENDTILIDAVKAISSLLSHGDLAMTGAVAFDTPAETDETAAANNATENDMTLLPDPTPAIGDAYYFGHSGTFDKLKLNIGTQGAGVWTITWKYWDGNSWEPLINVLDGTDHFRAAAGNHEVTFTIPTDWALKTIQSIEAYWISAEVTAYTSITTPPTGTQSWIVGRYEAVGTGNGTEFDLDHPNVDLGSLVVKVDGVVVKDYDITVKGHITFVTAPANGLAITASYIYWQIEQKGAFHNWAFSLTGDTAERTDFSTTGWKKFVSVLKGWTGSAERFWLNEKWMAEMGNLIIVKFYEDTGEAVLERHEGWALITGIDVSAAVDTLIMEPISFQGHGKLSPESG